jgi:hypothetical protein
LGCDSPCAIGVHVDVVLAAIGFNSHPVRDAGEVEDGAGQRILAAELVLRQTAVA